MHSSPKGLYMAVLSGSSAAFSSMFAKVATSQEGAHSVVTTFAALTENVSTTTTTSTKSTFFTPSTGDTVIIITIIVRLLGAVGTVGSNAVQWIFFSKALHLCSSSVIATVTSTATNFLVTACVSWLLLREVLPMLWWCGSGLIVMGLLLIHHGSRDRINMTMMVSTSLSADKKTT